MSLLRNRSHSCSMASCTSGICSMRAILSLSTLLRSAAALGSCWAFLFFFPVIVLPRLLICEDDWTGKNPQTSRAQKVLARSLFIRLSFGLTRRREAPPTLGDCWGTPGIPEYRLGVFERQRGFDRVFGGVPATRRIRRLRRNGRRKRLERVGRGVGHTVYAGDACRDACPYCDPRHGHQGPRATMMMGDPPHPALPGEENGIHERSCHVG